MNQSFIGAPNPKRLRRKIREKIFVYSMILMAGLFAYFFGYRPEWLYGAGWTTLSICNKPWMIDNAAHFMAGIGLAWIFIYRFRLSLDSKAKWASDVLAYSIGWGGVFWEFGIELLIDTFIFPHFPDVEKMQKGLIDTGVDISMVFLGSIMGLLIWKFVWRPGYMLLFPNSAKEEFLDEQAEVAAHARKEAKKRENVYKENRKVAVRAKKEEIKRSIKKRVRR